MSRAAMSRAAVLTRTARSASEVAASAAATVALAEADLARDARDALIVDAQRATMGSGPVLISGPVTAGERHRRELIALYGEYPIGSTVRFRSYDPTIRPRSWRRDAERAAWGLRRTDTLSVVAYGAASGFPEALMVRRDADGVDAPDILVFPDELLAASPAEPRAALKASKGMDAHG